MIGRVASPPPVDGLCGRDRAHVTVEQSIQACGTTLASSSRHVPQAQLLQGSEVMAEVLVHYDAWTADAVDAIKFNDNLGVRARAGQAEDEPDEGLLFLIARTSLLVNLATMMKVKFWRRREFNKSIDWLTGARNGALDVMHRRGWSDEQISTTI